MITRLGVPHGFVINVELRFLKILASGKKLECRFGAHPAVTQSDITDRDTTSRTDAVEKVPQICNRLKTKSVVIIEYTKRFLVQLTRDGQYPEALYSKGAGVLSSSSQDFDCHFRASTQTISPSAGTSDLGVVQGGQQTAKGRSVSIGILVFEDQDQL